MTDGCWDAGTGIGKLFRDGFAVRCNGQNIPYSLSPGLFCLRFVRIRVKMPGLRSELEQPEKHKTHS